MTTYGSTGYYISVSTGIAGSDATVYPTGDIVYLWAESYNMSRTNKDKIKQMANNNSYINRMGKMIREVSLTKCIMLDDDGSATTNTASYNNKITLLDYWCDMAESAIYLIITPLTDNPSFTQPNTNRVVSVALSRSGTSALSYLKSVISRFRTVPYGDVYMVDLSFKETSLY